MLKVPFCKTGIFLSFLALLIPSVQRAENNLAPLRFNAPDVTLNFGLGSRQRHQRYT